MDHRSPACAGSCWVSARVAGSPARWGHWPEGPTTQTVLDAFYLRRAPSPETRRSNRDTCFPPLRVLAWASSRGGGRPRAEGHRRRKQSSEGSATPGSQPGVVSRGPCASGPGREAPGVVSPRQRSQKRRKRLGQGLRPGGGRRGRWRRGASPICSPRGRAARGLAPAVPTRKWFWAGLGLRVGAAAPRSRLCRASFPRCPFRGTSARLLQSWAPFLCEVSGRPQPRLVSPLCCHSACVRPERALRPRVGDADPARREALARAPPAAPVLC